MSKVKTWEEFDDKLWDKKGLTGLETLAEVREAYRSALKAKVEAEIETLTELLPEGACDERVSILSRLYESRWFLSLLETVTPNRTKPKAMTKIENSDKERITKSSIEETKMVWPGYDKNPEGYPVSALPYCLGFQRGATAEHLHMKAHYEVELDGLKRDKAYWQLEAQAKYARITALEEALRETNRKASELTKAVQNYKVGPTKDVLFHVEAKVFSVLFDRLDLNDSLLSKETKE